MKLSPKQIQELFNIIEMNHLIYIGQVVGTDILTPEDIKLLGKFGVDIDSVKQDWPELEQSFYWGRLAQAVGNYAGQITYNDFTEYLKRGQYIPLNQTEKYALKYVKQNTYTHIRGLGDKIKVSMNGVVTENDPLLRASYEEVIRNAAERTIIERDSLQNMVLEIGHRTGDWKRDLGRIVDTEMQNAYQFGRAEQIKREQGSLSKVYKHVFPGACAHCIRLYTTNGIGSQPIVFTLQELQANGTNIGKKVKDWKAVISATHPWCRCELMFLPEGYVWDEDKGMFVPKKEENRQPKGITIYVGDKVFKV